MPFEFINKSYSLYILRKFLVFTFLVLFSVFFVSISLSKVSAEDNLYLRYQMEDTGTTLTDSAGSSRNATRSAGATTSTTGKFGQGLSFDGSTYFTLPTTLTPIQGTNSRTVSFWVKYSGAPSSMQTFFEAGNFSPNHGLYQLAYKTSWDTTNRWTLHTYNSGCVYNIDLTVGTWYNYVVTYDGVNANKMYLNGTLVCSYSQVLNTSTSNTPVLGKGNVYPGVISNVVMDEFRIYSKAINQTEVTSLYNNNSISTVTPTLSPTPIPAPTLSSINVSSISTSGGTVVLTGNNFYGNPIVTFGGTIGTNVNRINTTTINVIAPAHSAGLVNIVVTNPDSQTATLINGIRYIDYPTVSSINPLFGTVYGGTNVTISGTNFMTSTSATSFTSDSNTLGLWHLDEAPGATVYDSSSYGRNGTATGTTVIAGKTGNARSFTGTDYISIGNLGNFPTQGTIEFWINSPTLNSYPNAFSTNFNGGNSGIRFEEGSLGNFGIVVGNDSGTFNSCEYFPNFNMQTNTWYHIAYVWDTSTNQEIGYLNGSPICGGSHTLWPTTMPNVSIGSGFSSSRYWKGYIDEVRISNIARNNSDILLDAGKTYKPTVTFGGEFATNVFASSTTSITLTTPAHSFGNVDVVITNPDGSIVTSSGSFTYDGTPPSAPSMMTTSDENNGVIVESFTADIPTGSTDTGGSGLGAYSLWKCDNEALTINCVVIQSGVSGTTVTVSGEFLPSEDNTMYYYWTSVDNAGNTSNKSVAKALTMNAITPPPLTNTPTPTSSITLTPVQGGTTIQNVETGIEPVLKVDWDTNLKTTAQTGNVVVGVEDLVNANIKIAELDVNFNTAPDWTGVIGATAENIAFFHSTNPISTITNGAASSYSLFIRKGEGDKVWICPGVASLGEVTLTCSGGYFLIAGQTANGATASVVTIDSLDYWKVSGLTSTGGMSVLTGLRDTLTRLQISQPSDHKITFGSTYGMIAGNTDSMILSFPNFDLTGLSISDIDLTDSIGNSRNLAALPSANTWGVIIDSGAKTITFSVPTSGTGGYDAPSQIAIKIGLNAGGSTQITNPTSVGNSTITVTLNNTAPGEMGLVNIPFVDADQVDVTGYVTAYIHFDIDTATGEIPGTDTVIDCNYNTCQTYEGGDPGSNYTVDLGELTSAVVNKSNGTSVAHSSGGNGAINSIYFDISTNAPSGAVVTVKSANGGLQGPGTSKIPSIGVETGADGVVRNDGDDIPANSGVYGFNLPITSSMLHGSIVSNSLCDSEVKFCGAALTPKTVFTTNNLPIDTARVRLDLAAAANYTNNPGLYTDTLTFVATATF